MSGPDKRDSYLTLGTMPEHFKSENFETYVLVDELEHCMISWCCMCRADSLKQRQMCNCVVCAVQTLKCSKQT